MTLSTRAGESNRGYERVEDTDIEDARLPLDPVDLRKKDTFALIFFAIQVIFVVIMAIPGVLLAFTPFENDDLPATYYFTTLEVVYR